MQEHYRSSAVSAKVVDAGLRSHMIRVYNFMGLGLFLSAVVAWLGFDAAVVTASDGSIMGVTAFGAMLFGGGFLSVVPDACPTGIHSGFVFWCQSF